MLRSPGAGRCLLGRGCLRRADAAGVRARVDRRFVALLLHHLTSGGTAHTRTVRFPLPAPGTSSVTPACASAARTTCLFWATSLRRAQRSDWPRTPTGAPVKSKGDVVKPRLAALLPGLIDPISRFLMRRVFA